MSALRWFAEHANPMTDASTPVCKGCGTAPVYEQGWCRRCAEETLYAEPWEESVFEYWFCRILVVVAVPYFAYLVWQALHLPGAG